MMPCRRAQPSSTASGTTPWHRGLGVDCLPSPEGYVAFLSHPQLPTISPDGGDHRSGMHVKATSITIYTKGDTDTSRHFEGAAEINGAPGSTYSIDVADLGEPGRRTDTFRITLGTGY